MIIYERNSTRKNEAAPTASIFDTDKGIDYEIGKGKTAAGVRLLIAGVNTSDGDGIVYYDQAAISFWVKICNLIEDSHERKDALDVAARMIERSCRPSISLAQENAMIRGYDASILIHPPFALTKQKITIQKPILVPETDPRPNDEYMFINVLNGEVCVMPEHADDYRIAAFAESEGKNRIIWLNTQLIAYDKQINREGDEFVWDLELSSHGYGHKCCFCYGVTKYDYHQSVILINADPSEFFAIMHDSCYEKWTEGADIAYHHVVKLTAINEETIY